MSPQRKDTYRNAEVPVDEITAPFKGKLDDRVVQLLEHSFDRMPWRLYIHDPYTHWARGKVCILGDAAHPMMPNQSQGAVQSIEDAAALGIIFSDKYRYDLDVEAGLQLYERVRKPRATRVQQASLRATENINERIGFSTQPYAQGKVPTTGKLTTDEMNLYGASLVAVAGLAPSLGQSG
jgi:salicylate hydroxylase